MKVLLILAILCQVSLVHAQDGMSYIEFSMSKDEKAKLKNLRRYQSRLAKKKRLKRSKRKIVQRVKTKKAAPKIVKVYKEPKIYQLGRDLSFNYSATFNGPSLDPDYQPGATYNRTNTGIDDNGNEFDPTDTQQIYHALTIGYQLSDDYKVYYGFTFQDGLYKGIKYQNTNSDGSTYELNRLKGTTDNNKRLGLSISNILDNNYMNLSSSIFYEFPSTFSSQTSDMDFGLGMQPNLSVKNDISGLSFGTTASLQRNFYQRSEFYGTCNNNQKCTQATRYRTLSVSISPYLNYQLNDVVTLKKSFDFDWDQKGNEVNSTEVFNKNRDDVGKLAVNFNLGYGISAEPFIVYSLEKASAKRTMLGVSMSFNLF